MPAGTGANALRGASNYHQTYERVPVYSFRQYPFPALLPALFYRVISTGAVVLPIQHLELVDKHHGMGTNRAEAVCAVIELNSRLMPSEVDLVARIIGGDHLMSHWLDGNLPLYESRKVKGQALSPETIRARKTQVKKIAEQ